MAATKTLKKENAELRLEIDKLQSKINQISENISQRNVNSEGTHHSGHTASMLDKEKDKSVEFISAKYDKLVLFKTNTITELKQIKSEVN
ncbi:Hypothetical predicted protein, partial [Paramuricea clavata]